MSNAATLETSSIPFQTLAVSVLGDEGVLSLPQTGQLWRALRQEFLSFGSREPGWDGFGAAAPSPQLLESALDFLSGLQIQGTTPPSCVTLTPAGSVLVEWDEPDGHTDAELFAPSEVEWMRMQKGHPTSFWRERLCPRGRRPEGASTSAFQEFCYA